MTKTAAQNKHISGEKKYTSYHASFPYKCVLLTGIFALEMPAHICGIAVSCGRQT